MKVMRLVIVGVIALSFLCLVGGTAAFAQAGGPPKPGPEHAKLGYFVGTWQSEGVMNAGPLGPGGKMTSMDTCEWFDKKFAVVCNYEGMGPMGPTKGIVILTYEPMEKVYSYYGLGNDGQVMLTVPRGTLDKGTWTYLDESMMGGQMMKTRYVIRETSPTSQAWKWELQGEGGTWTTIAEGKSTKK